MQQVLERPLSVRGDIEIRVIHAASGELVRRLEIRNLILTNGLSFMGQLLAGSYTPVATATKHLGEIHVGTGTTAPTVSDTDLQTNPGGSVVAVPVTVSVATVSNTVEVKSTGQLTTLQANGYVISEAGLYSVDVALANPSIVARQVFPGITKTSALAIAFDWRITFTA